MEEKKEAEGAYESEGKREREREKTQALEFRLGGSLFGPAGTGKTESIKALGHQLGRFVLVFNCDETFDFQAMGRIFVGLCQVNSFIHWQILSKAN